MRADVFMVRLLSMLTALLLSAAVAPRAAKADVPVALKVEDLRCEHRRDPLGIDVTKPRLSWKLVSPKQDVRQSAYQVQAFDERGPLWDSGKVATDQSLFIPYAGKPLRTGQQIRWKVTVWDNAGQSAESAWATWEMGFLNGKDWKGEWLEALKRPLGAPVQRRKMFWLWYPEGDPAVSAPAATRWLRKTFNVPEGAAVETAFIGVAADARARVAINGSDMGMATGQASLTSFDVKNQLKPGDNEILLEVYNGGEAGGAIAQLQVSMVGGKILVVSTDRSWQASRDRQAWVPAMEAAPLGKGRYWADVRATYLGRIPSAGATEFRKAFTTRAEVKRARLYATALGVYEVEINGQRVGDSLLAPGWTDYGTRVQYEVHDVTGLLKNGGNAVGARLADGWYAGKIGFAGRAIYGDRPLVLLNLVVEYADGKRDVIVTDRSWKMHASAITESDLQDGETFDARLLQPAWSTPGFDDSKWDQVTIRPRSSVRTKLVATVDPPVRAIEERPALDVKPRGDGFVFDFGQNVPGFARLRVKGPAGTRVTLRFAEMLNPDGTLYTDNLRTARATDVYILRGDAAGEVWQPRFTFHGFRYAELRGFPGKPTRDALTAVVVHSDIRKTGRLWTSNKMLNQLVSNIDWGQRGNFLSVPTDCPQRDERLGWTGDAQVFARTATRFRDVGAFFTKWLYDVRDAQKPTGAFTDVAPSAPGTSQSTPAWGDAGVIVPWVLYTEYGDRGFLELQLPNMVKWVEWIRRNNPNLLWVNERGNNYGDWLSIDADTDKDVLATAFFFHSTTLLSKSADVLGRAAEAKRYAKLADDIRAAFNGAYVAADGRIKGDTQTAYVLALSFGLLPPERQQQAAAHLVNAIHAKKDHLSTGFIGVGHLLPALTQHGQNALAYKLLQNDTFPSWGYSIKQGATTIWERWDGWTDTKGFQTPSMNSFNHYSLGSVGEWMFGVMAGLTPEQAGYKRLRIAPVPGGALTEVGAELDTPYGRAMSHWTIKGKAFTLRVAVPPNTSATVVLPGRTVKRPEGIEASGVDTFAVPSGTYEFVAELRTP